MIEGSIRIVELVQSSRKDNKENGAGTLLLYLLQTAIFQKHKIAEKDILVLLCGTISLHKSLTTTRIIENENN